MRNTLLIAFFTAVGLFPLHAEDLFLNCHQRDENDRPYRTFDISIYGADSDAPLSEVNYALYSSNDNATPNDAGLLSGFGINDTYETYVSNRYRQISIQGGNLGITWNRDLIQLRKRANGRYDGSIEFPEGSEQVDLGWNSFLGLKCERL